MRFDFDCEEPATESQLSYMRRLAEKLDGVANGKYDEMDFGTMSKTIAAMKIDSLKNRLQKRRSKGTRK